MSVTLSGHQIKGTVLRPSPNQGGKFPAGKPDAIIVHFTGGASAESSVNWLCNPAAKASAHVVIGRDGKITQIVPFDTIAWHAGKSRYGTRSGYNSLAIGIELDNPGRLKRTEAGTFQSSFGRTYPAKEVLQAVHRNEQQPSYWLTYTEAQIDATFALCEALCATYPIQEILGHEEIAPGRKDDPGPAFPLDRLRQRLLLKGRDEDADEDSHNETLTASVIASSLNFRAAPSPTADRVAPALLQGTQVTLLSAQATNGWLPIRHGGKDGWVKAEFLQVESAQG